MFDLLVRQRSRGNRVLYRAFTWFMVVVCALAAVFELRPSVLYLNC